MTHWIGTATYEWRHPNSYTWELRTPFGPLVVERLQDGYEVGDHSEPDHYALDATLFRSIDTTVVPDMEREIDMAMFRDLPDAQSAAWDMVSDNLSVIAMSLNIDTPTSVTGP